ARAGLSVRVLEARDEIGGGTRTTELTLPGFRHDVCSAIHPLALVSPFFRKLRLEEHGVEFLQPPVAVAHPLDDGTAALLERSVEDTATRLDDDADAYRALLAPLVAVAPDLLHDLLAPLRVPSHPFALLRFALSGAGGAEQLARRFDSPHARALLAGAAAHSVQPLDRSPTAGLALLLMLAGHVVGWPLVRGGSSEIGRALGEILTEHGGEIETGHVVTSMSDLPEARVVLFDVAPRRLVEIAGDRLPARYRARLMRWRHGPGVFKVDYALHEPIPWTAKECARSATVHLGGSLEEIARAEKDVFAGRVPERPFVLLAQPTLYDETRAPEGKHIAWAYCHAPAGSDADLNDAIDAQIERFAPGFREVVAARHSLDARTLEAYNPNYVGGDITGGVQDLLQLFMRPAPRWDPYSTPARDIFLCSSSTPPGAGVHGMCGYLAARSALRRSL
ncbi:MAG TPA: NAD(P)/FAD-dependent oxidoreductase, partial [Actinomycetota bacterium]